MGGVKGFTTFSLIFTLLAVLAFAQDYGENCGGESCLNITDAHLQNYEECTIPVGGSTLEGNIIFCQGNYIISELITIWNSTKINCNNSNITFIGEGSFKSDDSFDMEPYDIYVTIENCNIFMENQGPAINLDTFLYGTLTIQNNHIQAIPSDQTFSRAADLFSQNIVIINNTIMDISDVFVGGYGASIRLENNIIMTNHRAIVLSPDLYMPEITENMLITIKNNQIIGLSGGVTGIELSGGNSPDSIISNNYIQNCKGAGMYLFDFDNGVITNNTIMNSDHMGLYHSAVILQQSGNNLVYENNFINNSRGITFAEFSQDNYIYHNNFVNNTYDLFNISSNQEISVLSVFEEKSNVWDKEKEGNYWSEFDDASEGCIDNNEDSICDSAFSVEDEGIDNYPYTRPYGWLDDFPLKLEIFVHSPYDSKTQIRGVPFNITTNMDAEVIPYIDNSIIRPEEIVLCRDCSEYGNTRRITKSFTEGEHNLIFKATKGVYSVEKNVSIFIDSINPRIIKTEPNIGFADGNFHVEFTEKNPENLDLFYGNPIREQEVDLDACTFDGRRYYCDVFVDLKDFEGSDIQYWFNLIDITGNNAVSKPNRLTVDTTPPKINKINYTISRKRAIFNISIEEKNLDAVKFIDNTESSPRWKLLCSRLKDGLCERTFSFSTGLHNLTINVTDKAGNYASREGIEFIII